MRLPALRRSALPSRRGAIAIQCGFYALETGTPEHLGFVVTRRRGLFHMKKVLLVTFASLTLVSVAACGKGKGKAPPVVAPIAAPVVTKG